MFYTITRATIISVFVVTNFVASDKSTSDKAQYAQWRARQRFKRQQHIASTRTTRRVLKLADNCRPLAMLADGDRDKYQKGFESFMRGLTVKSNNPHLL